MSRESVSSFPLSLLFPEFRVSIPISNYGLKLMSHEINLVYHVKNKQKEIENQSAFHIIQQRTVL